jgi:hypothetical protein
MPSSPAVTEREIQIANVLRPLGTNPLTREQAQTASKLLDIHWSHVYRLRRRFLASPVVSSVVPAKKRHRISIGSTLPCCSSLGRRTARLRASRCSNGWPENSFVASLRAC